MNKYDNNFEVRVASREEVGIAIDWAAQEGWNPGLNDAYCFFEADNEGFLIGYLEQQPIATISVVKYGQTFGFLGFYIVKPEFRGKGYGLKIWNAGLKHLKGRNIGLDGVVEQQENYQKSGFDLAYRNIRYAGTGGGDMPVGDNIKLLSEIPFEQLDNYDRDFFPENRSIFLRAWINQPQTTALGIMDNNQLSGYGVIRPCQEGHKIGPLFADSPDAADALYQALKASVTAEQKVFLDIPEVNSAALDLVKRYQMEVVFETARMYNKNQPGLAIEKLYGVTSFELG